MKTKKMFGYKYLFLVVIFLLFTTSISVSAAAPELVDSSIDVRAGGVYIFTGDEFVDSNSSANSINDIVIDAVPTIGTLQYDNGESIITVAVGQHVPINDIYGAACLRYIPNTGVADSFTWHATNVETDPYAEYSSNTVTMSINISEGFNHPPKTQPYTYTVFPSTSTTGLIYARDIDGDTMSYGFSAMPNSNKGTVVFTDQSIGAWRYTSKTSTGSTFFTVQVFDNYDYSFSSVTMTTDNLIITPAIYNVNMQSSANPRNVYSNISATLSSGYMYKQVAPIVAQHGLVTITPVNLATSNTWTYTPEPLFVGLDSFNITISHISAPIITKTVTVNVYVNDTLIVPNYDVTTPTNTLVAGTVVATGNGDGDTVTFAKQISTNHGTAVVNTDGTWTYTPDSGYTGLDTFTVNAVDQHGGTATSTINITTIGEYTINFDTDGGSDVASVTADSGTKLSVPTEPTKANNSFGGWYKEQNCTTPWVFNDDVVTGNATIYAKWIINTNAVTINITGSGTVTPLNPTVNYGETATFTITPAKGYEISLIKFDGATVANSGTYTTPAIFANKTLDVVFALKPLTPPSIITGVPEFKLNHTFTLEDNLNLKKRSDGQRVANTFKKSSISLARIINPDDYPLVSYGMILKDKTDLTRLPLNLPVPKTANGGYFAIQVFGKGVAGDFDESDVVFIKDNTYSLQAYLNYTDNGEQKTVYGLEESFTWQ